MRKVVAGGTTDFGAVMKAVLREVEGRAEARTVSMIVKEVL